MKIKGKKIEGPNRDILVIPRPGREDIVFTFEAVMDMTVFQKKCPPPKPPTIMRPGGVKDVLLTDKNFVKATEKYAQQNTNYLVLMSIAATEGLEWETVDLDNIDTWDNWKKELTDSGFSDAEIGRIINKVAEINGMDENKLEEARKRFLATQQAPQNGQDSQQDEQKTTPSGELAKDSESNHQDSPTSTAGKTR